MINAVHISDHDADPPRQGCRASRFSVVGVVLRVFVAAIALVGLGTTALATDESASLATAVGELSPNVFPSDRHDASRKSLSRDLHARIQAANDASRAVWSKIDTLEQWRRFRAEHVEHLREGLGRWPTVPANIRRRVTGSIAADDYVVDNIVYESRPGLWVTANLYRPANPPAASAGIIISHSHHAPKHQRELQDMGATWARAGCYVLVPDHLGHGERGQHGFAAEKDYPQAFRVGRQDYYFRYDSSVQLYLVGESLMGLMAWDLMRGVDVLLSQPNVDRNRIIMLGAVAGGGDPCAVAAALDKRISCAVPFNFGGPQPETRYPLPEDAETSFNYAGGGSWESTRNLANSARSGETFLPWEIVAAIAPRRLVYGHEFSWDRQRDPVWKRFERVWALHDAAEHLEFAHGRGDLKSSPPAATHCNNIGEEHRKSINEALQRWFDIDAREYRVPRTTNGTTAMTAAAAEELKPRKLYELLRDTADESLAAARKQRGDMSPYEIRRSLRADLMRLLGDVEAAPADVTAVERTTFEFGGGVNAERILIKTSQGMELPLLILSKEGRDPAPRPAVIGLSQSGKAGFLADAAAGIARLVEAGWAVCLADVRDTGELAADDSHGQFSTSTDRAATALMVGDCLVAQQLRDARTVLAFLRKREDVDSARVAVWGATFAPARAADTNIRVPRRISDRPRDVEPLGGLLALLLAVCDDSIAAVCVDRGLLSFRGVLESEFAYVPLESVIPGLLLQADVSDLTVAVAPRPVMFHACVNATNRRIEPNTAAEILRTAADAYTRQRATSDFVTDANSSPADWLIGRVKHKD